MKPQWDNQISILETALQQLTDLSVRLPASFSIQGITISINDLSRSFSEIIWITKAIANSEDIDPILLGIHQNGIVNVCNQIPQTMSNLSANPQSSYLEQLANFVWSIRSSLIWLVKPNMPNYFFNTAKDIDLIGKIEATEVLYNKLLETSKDVDNFVSQINNSDQQIKELLNIIQGYEREASNAKTNAESSSSQALNSKETIQELLTKLESGQTQQKELLEKINSLQEQASLVLEGNSKAGLAKSFATRKENLEKNLESWKKAFFVGIVLLIFGIVFTFLALPSLIVNGSIDAWGVLSRILFTGPAIWYTWFAARQYSHTMRLIEDYAFKEASALAYIGYNREMSQDQDMIKLLRETAIKNFGAPPTRMLSVSEPTSPLHELIDGSLRKGNIDKLIEILKAINPTKESKS